MVVVVVVVVVVLVVVVVAVVAVGVGFGFDVVLVVSCLALPSLVSSCLLTSPGFALRRRLSSIHDYPCYCSTTTSIHLVLSTECVYTWGVLDVHNLGVKNDTWEFPKVGDPKIVPEIVGSLL